MITDIKLYIIDLRRDMMQDIKTTSGDKMIDVQLAEKSRILNISVDDLIDRYI